MTLFTAEGLINTFKINRIPNKKQIITEIKNSYLDWLQTQELDLPIKTQGLLSKSGLFKHRAPGNTCLSALKHIKKQMKFVQLKIQLIIAKDMVDL